MTDQLSGGLDSLASIARVRVPTAVVAEVQEFLRWRGTLGAEGVAFWAGVREGDEFDVRSAVIPAQQAMNTEAGEVAVVVGAEALRQMNVGLYRQRLTLIAQIHSHPGAAYHSDTDDAYAIVARSGGLSIVVPDFARGPFALRGAAVYRLDATGLWRGLSTEEAARLITFYD